MPYVHLHNHTQFSILHGVPTPEDLVKAAAKYNMPAVALTDTCNFFGAVQFYKASKGSSVKPIFGTELWLWPQGIDNLSTAQGDGGWHLNFLVENKEGYHNLSKLITEAIYNGLHYRPRIDFALLEKYSKGLIVSTSGLNGPLGYALYQEDSHTQAKNILEKLGNIFDKDHLYLELQDFAIPKQIEMNQLAREMSAELGLDTIVTNDTRYIHAKDAVTLDMLNCIAFGEAINNPKRLRIESDQQYFKTEEEMYALFGDTDPEALERTGLIAERCNYSFKFGTYWFPATTPPDPDRTLENGQPAKMNEKEYWANTQRNWEYFYKAFPPPRSFNLPDPATDPIPPKPDAVGNMSSYFEWYCTEGLKIRLGTDDRSKHPEYWERLDFETNIIEGMGFPAYMLIVAEFINWSKDNEIPVGPGRGSAAGSLVAWAMGITDIDPLRYALLFERFLNPERISMPDIDVDFCQDRRELAIKHVRDKYGTELVSQIITYGKLAAKAAIKDVARALGLDFRLSNEIASLVPEKPGTMLSEALDQPEVQARMNLHPLIRRVFTIAHNIEGKTRQTGIHAAGVVIADRPLVEHAPLYRDGEDSGPVVQYDMKSSESIGLIKFDFLGLKTLDQIRDALKMIKRNHNVDIDMQNLPTESSDPAFHLLQQGDSVGVFQLESSGMQALLLRMKPTNIEDIIASIALFRPGPLQSGMDKTFVDCKNGHQPIEYLHPKLENVLSNTYGSIVYQEQVMQIAQELASYSLGEADLLRRAMGKKDVKEMERQKSLFTERAVQNGVKENLANEIFDLMAYFAGYGFNKSHSAAYGWISYQTAWLKAHYRPEYMAALMTSESGNAEKVQNFIWDCMFPQEPENRVKVEYPCINKSMVEFNVLPKTRNIRYGLLAIKGVGINAVESIVKTRDSGDFTSFMDFLERIDHQQVNKKVIENLIKCGAFDWTKTSRRALLEAFPEALTIAQKNQEEKKRGQLSLFGEDFSIPDFEIVDTGEWSRDEKTKQEMIALGFYLTDHPIRDYDDFRKDTVKSASLRNHKEEKEDYFVGMCSSFRIFPGNNNSMRGLAILEDEEGIIEIPFYEPNLSKNQTVLQDGGPLRIKVNRQVKDGKIRITGIETTSLLDIREKQTRLVRIHLQSTQLQDAFCQRLQTVLQEKPGRIPVELAVAYTKKSESAVLYMNTNITVNPSDELRKVLQEFLQVPKSVEFLSVVYE